MSRAAAAQTDREYDRQTEDGFDLRSLEEGIELLSRLETTLAEMQASIGRLSPLQP